MMSNEERMSFSEYNLDRVLEVLNQVLKEEKEEESCQDG